MPRFKRILTGVMWGSAAVLVLAALVCIVTANFLFPASDQAVLPDLPGDSTFFHPTDPPAITAWKVSFTIGGIALAVLLLGAMLHGLFFPPAPDQGAPNSP
jgi:hypothetical protein